MAVLRFPVDESLVLQFARAVCDPNPVYTDPVYAAASPVGALLAPPTFMMAADHFDPDYTRRPQIGRPWFGSGRTPTGVPEVGNAQKGFHAEQRFVYHRHARVGDVLSATVRSGEPWTKHGRRGGLLRFSETHTDFVDASGAPVVTATFVGVRTEVLVDEQHVGTDPGASGRDEPAPVSDTSVTVQQLGAFVLGTTVERVLVDDLTRTQIAMYAGASGDFHPLHHDATFAEHLGFPGIFAHGMLTMGLTSRLVTDLVGDAALRTWSARFLGTVWPGDTLRATATVVGLRVDEEPLVTLDVCTTNQHGVPVLRGTATASATGCGI
jgi:acyl dehydratase